MGITKNIKSQRFSMGLYNSRPFDAFQMNMSSFYCFIILAFTIISLVGCASTFGGTKAFTVPLGREFSDLKGPMKVASVEMEAGASRLAYEGLVGVGEFDSTDLEVLRESIRRTILPAATTPAWESGLNFDLFVVIRAYILCQTIGASGQFKVLACVAWCLANPSGEIVYHEQFFASNKGSIWATTIGALKNKANLNLIRRIAVKALNVIKINPPTQEPVFPGTYNDFDSAAKPLGLPDTLFEPTSGVKTKFSGNQYTMYVEGIKKDADWNRAERKGLINWQSYIATQRSKNK